MDYLTFKKTAIALLVVMGASVIGFAHLGDKIPYDSWLTFTGAVFGGILTLFAVLMSTHQSEKMYQQNEIYHQREIMPFIVINPIEIVDRNIYLQSLSDIIHADGWNKLDKIVRFSAGDMTHVVAYDITPNRLNEIVKNLRNNEFYYRRLTLINIGADAAYNINIKIQNTGVFSGLTMIKDKRLSLLLEIDNTHGGDESKNYEIDFKIDFCDRVGREYTQNNSCEANHRDAKRVPPPKNNQPKFIQ